MIDFIKRPFIAASLVAAAMSVCGAPAQAIELQSHTARYDLVLEEARIPGQLLDFGGELLLRIEKTCSKWIVFSRLTFSIDSAASIPLEVETISMTEEDFSGELMNFRTQHRINGEVLQNYAGSVEGRVISLAEPERKKITLDPEVMFPIEAAKLTMGRLMDGRKFQSYKLYSGDGLEAIQVTDVLAGDAKVRLPDPKGDAGLLDGRRVRVVSSYFTIAREDAEPYSVNTSEITERGVTSWLSFDANLIKAVAELTHIEAIEPPVCKGSQ